MALEANSKLCGIKLKLQLKARGTWFPHKRSQVLYNIS